MVFPTVAEFREVLLTRRPEDIVAEYVFGGEPYVFRTSAPRFRLLKSRLSEELQIASQEDITIVGSGKLGFSLKPDTFGAPFSEYSDVDVMIVDEVQFDLVWISLLRWHYPRRSEPLAGVEGNWAKHRRRELYWGWFAPERITFDGLIRPQALKPLRDMATTWFNTFRGLSTNLELVGRNFNGRLYRSWEHARLYHVAGLAQVAQMLRNPGG